MTAVLLTAPDEALAVNQSRNWINGLCGEWIWDAAMPCGPDMCDEFSELMEEVIVGDVYDLQRMTQPGDVWVDAGCHVGLFSIGALMAGADVSVMYDMDPTLAWCAESNVRAFLMQQLVRDYRRRIRPVAIVDEITRPDGLVEAGMQVKEVWSEYRRSCLKLDVQGAEQAILALDGSRKLADAYDLMVLEWHYPDDLTWLKDHLERGGWSIKRVMRHKDVLLNADTHIVWAHTG